MIREIEKAWRVIIFCISLLLVVNLSACRLARANMAYTDWDADENEMIDRDEFYSTLNDRYNEWDVNDDTFLDEPEFASFYRDYDYYSDWDVDKDRLLNENEFSTGLFSLWDADRNGYLDEVEYEENYNTYLGY